MAMAQRQAGHADDARATFAKAGNLAAKLPKLNGGDLGENWREVLAARTFQREAQTLFGASAATGSQIHRD
jgi:hypothetical protein